MSTGSTLARRTGLDPGCGHGRRYRDREAAEKARAGDEAREPRECSSRPGTWHLVPVVRVPSLVRNVPLERGTGKIAPRRKAGTASGKKLPPPEFTDAVKLAVRKRAGRGDEFQAQCEACPRWLGRDEGEFHHRANRGSGGCRDAVTNSAANCVLICNPCHAKCTASDPDMKGAGFWIEHGTTLAYDPRHVGIMLHSPGGGGGTFYLAEDGLGPEGTGYLRQPPDLEAEAA